MHLFWKD